MTRITHGQCHSDRDKEICRGEEQAQEKYIAEIKLHPCGVGRDSPVVEARQSHVKQQREKNRKTEERKIETIGFFAGYVLYRTVNTKNPEGFDDDAHGNQKNNIYKEFSPQGDLRMTLIK